MQPLIEKYSTSAKVVRNNSPPTTLRTMMRTNFHVGHCPDDEDEAGG